MVYERRRRRRLNPRFVILCAAGALLAAGGIWLLVSALGGGHEPEGKDIPVPEYVVQDYLPENQWSRPGEALEKIKGVVIHYVGNPGTTAQANRNYFASLAEGKEETYASSHFVIGLEGEVIQCVPLTEIAYASNSRNSDTVSIEVCHPDEGGEFTEESYRRCVELTAWLCETFRLDPEKDVIRHFDVTGKRCPLYYVEHPESWRDFLRDVAAEKEALREAEKEAG